MADLKHCDDLSQKIKDKVVEVASLSDRMERVEKFKELSPPEMMEVMKGMDCAPKFMAIGETSLSESKAQELFNELAASDFDIAGNPDILVKYKLASPVELSSGGKTNLTRINGHLSLTITLESGGEIEITKSGDKYSAARTR